MNIDSFIAQRRPDWVKLEQACRDGRRGLTRLSGEQIADLVTTYLVVTSDLSEVQTRYRDRELSAYLSRILAAASSALYSAKPRTVQGFLGVFGARYRVAVRDTMPYVLVAAIFLFGSLGGAYLWVIASPEAREGVIPPQAREAMERAGDREGEAMGPGVSAYIFFNNARVAFLSFAAGITLGVGTLALLLYNGALVGALGGGYAALGQAGPFWSLILPHGILELTAICIGAGAGLRIGWAVISPGDRLRSRALAEESAQAVVAVVGVVPAFLVAALIEGLVTGSSIPVGVQIGLGVAAEILYLAFLAGWPRSRPAGRQEPVVTAARTPSA